MAEDKKGKDLVVFLDTIGRTIIAERLEEDDSEIKVKNPAVVNIVPQEIRDQVGNVTGQRMALQLFPLFFREFLAAKNEDVKFIYKKNNITRSDGDIALDFKVGIQYDQLFAVVGEINPATEGQENAAPAPTPEAAPAPQSPQEQGGNIIKLFND